MRRFCSNISGAASKQVVPNDSKGEREELARKATAGHVQRQIDEAVENKQPHTREVPLARATEPTA